MKLETLRKKLAIAEEAAAKAVSAAARAEGKRDALEALVSQKERELKAMAKDMTHSFGRNLDMIFGSAGKFAGMGNRPLKNVILSDDKSEVTFSFIEGPDVRFGVEGDCCSHSWIEALSVPHDVYGQTLVDVQDEFMEEENSDEYECLRSYQTKFRTDKGETITLEYRNSSNGYYGGYLVRYDANGSREY